MIKLFGGKDQYFSFTKANLEAQKLSKDLGIPLKILNADEVDSVEEFIQEIEGIGIFSESSVFLIKRLSENKKIENYFINNYLNLKNLDIFLWEAGSPDGRNKFIQNLKKDGLLFLYDESNERELAKWIREEIRKEKINFKNDSLEYFIQNVEKDRFVIISEIKKIRLFLKNKGKDEVTQSDLNEILGFNIKGNIWKFLEYLGERERKKCISEYLKLSAFEDNTQYLIAMIERELSILSQIKYCETNNIDLRDLKLHPFVLQKSQSKSRNFKMNEIKLFLYKLLSLDSAIKRGDIDGKLGMSLYLLSF